ncbi:MAG: hypothetical protein IVW55_02640 [Chloroflexi bacterium]|nr:hypothetical protein [Chloroflexota bacterium]
MSDSERYKIAKTLQREATYVAQLAEKNFAENASVNASVPAYTMGAFGDIPGLEGSVHGPVDRDEVRAMMQDGFRRLGGVVALSVLVDEPGLIVDDLQWLARIFSARQMEIRDPMWFDDLLTAYVKGAAAVLQSGDVPLVAGVVERAMAALTEPVC